MCFLAFSDSKSFGTRQDSMQTNKAGLLRPTNSEQATSSLREGEGCIDKLHHTYWEDDNCPFDVGCYFQCPSAKAVVYQVLIAGRESERTHQHTTHSLIQ